MGLDLLILDSEDIDEDIPFVHFTYSGYHKFKRMLVTYAIKYVENLIKNNETNNNEYNDVKELLSHLTNLISSIIDLSCIREEGYYNDKLGMLKMMNDLRNSEINKDYLIKNKCTIVELLRINKLYGIMTIIDHSDGDGFLTAGEAYDIHETLKLLFDYVEVDDPYKNWFPDIIKFFELASKYKKIIEYC